jgi:hypothetical protein
MDAMMLQAQPLFANYRKKAKSTKILKVKVFKYE